MWHIGRSVGAVAVASLSIGVAANVAVFSVAHDLLFAAPKGVSEASHLRLLRLPGGERPATLVSLDELRRLDAAVRSQGVARASGWTRLVTTARTESKTVETTLSLIDSEYWSMVGAGLTAGSIEPLVSPSKAATPGVVVSNAFARRVERLQVGSALFVKGVPVVVSGIAQPDFVGTDRDPTDIWISSNYLPEILGTDTTADVPKFAVLFRLAAGVTEETVVAATEATLGVRSATLRRVTRISENATDAAQTLYVLMQGVASLLFLAAILNATGIAAADAANRRREMAIRLALGARQRHILLLMIREGLALAVPATLLSVPVFLFIKYLFVHWSVPSEMARLFGDGFMETLRQVWGAFALAMLGSLAAVILGKVALNRTAARLASDLGRSPDVRQTTARRWQTVVQTALVVAILLVLSLFLQARRFVSHATADVIAAGVSFLEIRPRSLAYDEDEARGLIRLLIGASESGSLGARLALSRDTPVEVNGWAHDISIPGDQGSLTSASYNVVSSEFARLYRLPLTAGRWFGPDDAENAPPVIVLGARLASRWWRTESPLGSVVYLSGEAVPRTVVGVVDDVLVNALRPDQVAHSFYIPVTQTFPVPTADLTLSFPADAASSTVRALELVLAAYDPDLALTPVSRLEDRATDVTALQTLLARFTLQVSVLLVISLGLGLNASVRRTLDAMRKECAIRLAIGCSVTRLSIHLSRRVMLWVILGTLPGWALGWWASQLLLGVSYGASVFTPLSIGIVSLTLGICVSMALAGPLADLARLQPREVLSD